MKLVSISPLSTVRLICNVQFTEIITVFPVISGWHWEKPVDVLLDDYPVYKIRYVVFPQGTAATLLKWGGRLYNFLMWKFLRFCKLKIIKISSFSLSYSKYKQAEVFLRHGMYKLTLTSICMFWCIPEMDVTYWQHWYCWEHLTTRTSHLTIEIVSTGVSVLWVSWRVLSLADTIQVRSTNLRFSYVKYFQESTHQKLLKWTDFNHFFVYGIMTYTLYTMQYRE